jgi:site-specific recombinase XerC
VKNCNPRNERIKRYYFQYLREADQKSEATVRGIEKAIARFEEYTGFADFGKFKAAQAMGFKASVAEGGKDRKPLSKATILSTVNALQRFFRWLNCQPGFRSKIKLSDIDYFNLSEKDVRAATSPKPKNYPSLEQFRRALFAMPSESVTERRDQAVMAFAILTGIRDSALVSLCLKHVDLDRKLVMQDPNEVRTKNSKRSGISAKMPRSSPGQQAASIPSRDSCTMVSSSGSGQTPRQCGLSSSAPLRR